MALVIETESGWLDVDEYLNASPGRRILFLWIAATFLERPTVEIRQRLAGGWSLADLAQTHGKDVDLLKARLVADLQHTVASPTSATLRQLVEQLVDLPLGEPPSDLVG